MNITINTKPAPVACRILAKRKSDGFSLYVWGEGDTLYKASANACDKAGAVLCPESATPGFEFIVISGEWVERANLRRAA